MNIVVTRAAEGFARRAFTVDEILRMVQAGIIAEDEDFELVEGEVVPMAPKGNQHEVLKSALNLLIARHLPEDLRLGIETSIYLDKHTFLEPDLCLYPKRLLPDEVKGEDVLLAIEVAGSSLGYDRGPKARIYAKHGVREFWVLDARSRVTWVHTRPVVDGSWGSVEERPADAVLSTPLLQGLTIRTAELD
jgi:Uma2 family endonuclease